MTIEQMRALLGLGPEYSDAAVAEAYARFLAGGEDDTPAELITVEEAADHLKVDAADPVLPAMIAAAISHVDGPTGWLGRALTPQTIQRRFASPSLRLPYPPLLEVLLVEYRDGSGAWTLVPSPSYAVSDNAIELVDGGVLPSSCDWRITWRAGYDGNPGRELPAAIKAALLLITGSLYANREDFTAPSGAAAALLQPYRVFR